jgi:hypothetical protein
MKIMASAMGSAFAMRLGKAISLLERSPSHRLYAAGFDPHSKNDTHETARKGSW